MQPCIYFSSNSTSIMDVVSNRFPLLTKNIFNILDNKTLMSCKEVNRELYNFIEKQKNVWLRIIRLYRGNIIGFEDSWKRTIEKDSVDNIKQLALATQKFFKHEPRFLNQWHPLFIAAAEGSSELCKHVMEKTGENNPSIVNHIPSTTATGYTALHFAAQFGYLDAARLIINRIEDKNPIDSHEKTPYFYSAHQDDVSVYIFFVNLAVDKMPENIWGWTPCHEAAYLGNLKVLELMLENLVDKNPPTTKGRNIGVTPLHLAAQEGHVNVCRFILKYVKEKNPSKEDGVTPLHSAAYFGHLEACKVLIEEARNKQPVTRAGRTPAFCAKRNKHDKVYQYLLKYLKENDLQRNEGWLTRVRKEILYWLIMQLG